MASRYKSYLVVAQASTLIAAVLLVSACGGSSSTNNASTRDNSPGKSSQRTIAQHHGDIVSNGTTTQQPMHGTGGDEINDDNPGRADSGNGSANGLNPCTLVPEAEVRAIIGKPIATPQEAPLGPTCIYRSPSANSQITVTVESVDFAKIKPQIRDRARISLARHTAYCGDYGQQTTFVPLSDDRVLDITAPCTIGTRLAEKAMSRLQG